MDYILHNTHWFMLLIGALVFFHELGHFLVAKAFDVKVVRFSLGFGPKIFAFTRGETEYTISLLPLGGYVKMVGEDPSEIGPEDAGRALSQKPLWQRSAIVLAGPAANMLLAWVVYMTMFCGAHTFGDTRLGIVTPNEAAWSAGIRPGDRIVEVDGRAISRWDELQAAIASHPKQKLPMVYERAGVRSSVVLDVSARREADALNEMSERGKAGLSLMYVRPILAVVDATSPAAKAGLQGGDAIVQIDGQPIEAWHELRAALLANRPAGGAHALRVQRGNDTLDVALTPGPYPQALAPETGLSDRFSSADAPGATGYTGLVSNNVVVATVQADTPAASAGMRVGDRILTLIVHKDGAQADARTIRRPVGVWDVDLAAFGLDANTELGLEVQRGAQVQTLAVRLVAEKNTDPLKQAGERFDLGVGNAAGSMDFYGFTAPVGPLEGAREAARQVGDDMSLIGRGIVKMVRGDIPLKSMGGPIMLFVIAEKSANQGWQSFGRALAMTSVNLGMLNILPVPVLDGGHLLFYGIEAITRRPPSVRVREIANMVGLGLLLMLMAVVFRNDIARFFFGVF